MVFFGAPPYLLSFRLSRQQQNESGNDRELCPSSKPNSREATGQQDVRYSHFIGSIRYKQIFDSLQSPIHERQRTEEAQAFLTKPSTLWSTDPTFLKLKTKVRLLKVVNDCAERGISLIQSYNSALTKDETQKQYLLQLVSHHGKQFPAATKMALKTKRQH